MLSVKKITFFFCFCIAVFFAEAQLPTIATPTILPQNPTATSVVKVVVRVSASGPLVIVDPNSYTVTGFQVKIKGCFSLGMSPFASSYLDTIIIGQLPVGNYQIKQLAYLSSTQQHCTPIDSNQVTLSLTVSSGTLSTGIGEAKEPVDGSLYLYPNPSVSNLFISGISSEVEVFIYSATGALVSRKQVNNNSIDIQNLPAGLYFISITHKGKNQTLKFIKSVAGQ